MNIYYYLKIFLKCLFLQATQNFQCMQNVGFAWIIDKDLTRIHKNTKKIERARQRHREFFNTNPVMAPSIIGGVIKMESDNKSEEEIRTYKNNLMGPMAAIGDGFFWMSLKPFFSIIAVLFLIHGYFLGAIICIVLYNIIQFSIRAILLLSGLKEQNNVINTVTKLNLVKLGNILKVLGTAIVALVFVQYISNDLFPVEIFKQNISFLIALIITIFGFLLINKLQKPITALYIFTLLVIITTTIFDIL